MANITKVDKNGNYWCNRCKKYHPLDEFYASRPSQRGLRSPHCKVCTGELNYLTRHKKRIKEIGPDAYQLELDHEKRMLQERFKLLDKYRKEET